MNESPQAWKLIEQSNVIFFLNSSKMKKIMNTKLVEMIEKIEKERKKIPLEVLKVWTYLTINKIWP
jgi:hypothetical protein